MQACIPSDQGVAANTGRETTAALVHYILHSSSEGGEGNVGGFKDEVVFDTENEASMKLACEDENRVAWERRSRGLTFPPS